MELGVYAGERDSSFLFSEITSTLDTVATKMMPLSPVATPFGCPDVDRDDVLMES